MFAIWRCLPSESRQRPRLVLLVPVSVAIDAARIEKDFAKAHLKTVRTSLSLFFCVLSV